MGREQGARKPVEILKSQLHAGVSQFDVNIIRWSVLWADIILTAERWHCDGFSFGEVLREVVRNASIYVVLQNRERKKKDTSLVTSKWAYTNWVNAGVAVQAALLCMPLTDNTFQNMHLFPSGTMCIWHNIWFYKAIWSSSNYHRCERFGELTFEALIRASSALQPFAVGTGFPNLWRL